MHYLFDWSTSLVCLLCRQLCWCAGKRDVGRQIWPQDHLHQGGNSMEQIWIEFYLGKPLEFWLEIPYSARAQDGPQDMEGN